MNKSVIIWGVIGFVVLAGVFIFYMNVVSVTRQCPAGLQICGTGCIPTNAHCGDGQNYCLEPTRENCYTCGDGQRFCGMFCIAKNKRCCMAGQCEMNSFNQTKVVIQIDSGDTGNSGDTGTETPPEEPEEVIGNTTIDSYTCTYTYTDNWGDRHWELKASGTAYGIEGAELQLTFNPGYFVGGQYCSGCAASCEWGASTLQFCQRKPGQSSTTPWSVFVPDSQVMDGNNLEIANYEIELRARIFLNNNFIFEESKIVTCTS